MAKKGYKKNIQATVFDTPTNRKTILTFNRKTKQANKKSRKYGFQAELLKTRNVMSGPYKMIETWFWRK